MAQPLERPSRTRAREAVSSSIPSSRCSEEDEGKEDATNPYVSDRERSDLLSDSENELGSDDDDNLKEPEACKEAFHSISSIRRLL